MWWIFPLIHWYYLSQFLIFVLNKIQNVICVPFFCKAEFPNTPVPSRLEMPKFTPPPHLEPTIYPTEVGVSSVGRRGAGGQMLSTAIKITLDLQRNVKVTIPFKCTVSVNVLFFLFFLHIYTYFLFSSQEFLVALRLQGATLRHHMALTNHSWHEQVPVTERRKKRLEWFYECKFL